jgi:site-specific recombinase XerD
MDIYSPVVIDGPLPAPAEHRPPNPYTVYIDRLESEQSKKTMKGCLRRIAEMSDQGGVGPADIPWGRMRYAHAVDIRKRLMERTRIEHGQDVPWTPSYINTHLSALRGIAKEAWQLGQMPTDEYTRIRELPGVKGSRLPAGRNLAIAEYATMLDVCQDGTLLGNRNGAIIATLCATGARRAEIAGARREHYDPGERALRIVGKGNKQREMYLNEDAAVYLGAWLARLDGRTGPLFCPIDRWGNVTHRHLSTQAVSDVVEGVRRAAKLPKLTAHDFRRTIIGELLDKGVDLATVQSMVGHSSPATTARYDRRPAAARKAAANLLRLPRRDEL